MKTVLSIFLILFLTNLLAQTKQEKRDLKAARTALSSGDYTTAKIAYEKLTNTDVNNVDYWFERGLAYYNSKQEKELSIPHFEKSLTIDTIGEAFYYLGRANQFAGNFEEAIVYYNKFENHLKDNKKGITLGKDVTKYITMCNNGISIKKQYETQTKSEIIVSNLGGSINSNYPEYAPIVNEDESILIFTARELSSTGGKFYHDNRKYEDIYVSSIGEEKWNSRSKIDSSNKYFNGNINSKFHDAGIGYNIDESILYIYRKNHIWQSTKKDGKYGEPVKLGKTINSGTHDPSVYLTPDGKKLYFTSDRSDGLGGRDIWVSEITGEGVWGEAKNIGDKINTIYDEDAPYISKDGQTFFFSSNNLQSMGGYDVFKCELQENGTWSDPVNIGYPINSGGDDIYYVQDSTAETGYFSSSRVGGHGDMDIYHVELTCKNIPNTEVRGIVYAGDFQNPVKSNITVKNENGEVVGNYTSDPKTGKYLMILPPEATYQLEIEAVGFEASRAHKETFTIPKQCEYFQLYQEVSISRDKSPTGKEYQQVAVFHNAMFDVKTEAEALYGIQDEANLNYSPKDTTFNLTGEVMHNDIVNAKDVEIMLINDNNEIIRVARTNKDGKFNFVNVNSNENYSVLINEVDLKESYYGPQTENSSVIAKGKLNLVKVDGNNSTITSVPADSMNLKLIKGDKSVVNFTSSDIAGNYIIDNVPQNEVNDQSSFTYNIDRFDADIVYSAFIKTIDTTNSELAYSEIIDIIPLDTTAIKYPCEQFGNIYFGFDKYFLRSESKNLMDNLFQYLSDHPDATLEVGGHTDWFGSNKYNMRLSKNRMNSAKKYLVAKGLSDSRISENFYGEEKPAVRNDNPDGSDNKVNRQTNRRVEFRINCGNDTTFLIEVN